MCPGFAGSDTFKVSLPPEVDCLGLRDGIASWQLCPFLHRMPLLLSMCSESQGLHKALGKVPFHRVGFHWGLGQG